MSNIVLETKNLTKKFHEVEVVNSINLKVREKTVYGFLGPNGAGKTTTIRMILGLLSATKGEVDLFGENLNANRRSILSRIGSLVENPSLYGHLTAKENLEIYRILLSVRKKRIDEVLQQVDLEKARGKKVKHFSLGMKQRLAIAIALLNNPELVILDEPTNGLDPAGIKEIREFISSLPEKSGVTVLLSSHMLHEIEQVADDVGIINKGKLIFQGSLLDLKTEMKGGYEISTSDDAKARKIIEKDGLNSRANKEGFWVETADREQISEIVNKMVEGRIKVYEVRPVENSLEEIFLKVTNDNESN